MGKTEVSESVGTAKDVADSVDGSKSRPDLSQQPRQGKVFDGAYSKVYVKVGMTKALGEFQFARIDVGIEEFCEANPKARREALHAVTEEAKAHLRQTMMKVVAASTGRPMPDGTEEGQPVLADDLNPDTYAAGALLEDSTHGEG